jgi:hypothetical protein
MDACVCLCDIDPTDANAARLVLGDEKVEAAQAEEGSRRRYRKIPEARGEAARRIRASSPSQFSQT